MKFRTICLITALTAFAGGGALAQQQAGGPPAGPHGPWGPAAMHQRMEEKRAAHLRAVHDALNIRPDQEAAFSAFATAISPRGDAEGHGPDEMDGGAPDLDALTTPERLDRMAQRMIEHFETMKAAFQRRADATKALYNALDANQRRTLDALLTLRALEGEHGGHGMHDHGLGGPEGA